MTDSKPEKPTDDDLKKKLTHFIGGVGIIIVLGFIVNVFSDPAAVTKAKNELEIHYFNQEIYGLVGCDTKEVEGHWFIRCRPSNSDIVGGLYMVSLDEDNDQAYKIHPVNGKSRSHGQKGGTMTLYEHNFQIDIPGVLSEFE